MAANPLQQPSLPSLPGHQLTENGITGHLSSRFHAHLPVTHLSSHGFVALNTNTDPSQGVDGKDGSAHQAIEELAQHAYVRLGQRSEDQAVVFL
jgi:chitin synthase